jgi:uncharacterized membrane protein YadS
VTTLFPAGKPVWIALSHTARIGFAGTLFLIGSGISVQAVRKVGWRPLAMGVCLWLTVSTVTLGLISKGWISLN